MNRIKDKIALVTGASQGIGEAISRLFAEEGAFVVVTDVLNDFGIKVADSLKDRGCYLSLDVRYEKDWNEAFQFIKEQFGQLDILVNNAGIMGLGEKLGSQDPEHASLESWRLIQSVNAEGVFLGCKYAIGLMKEKGGSIINISSRSGMVGVPSVAAYAASKAAVRNHTKSVALYCAEQGYNIRCNSLHPAAILTPIWDPILKENSHLSLERLKKIEEGIPLGKMGEPIDVAYAALYLASHESKYITGAELIIDGGVLAGSASTPKVEKKEESL
ncbi:MAG: SDR family oxidoreductase [Alphaproteobacteria bacterium]|nr:SDR family oxidoreductase [Alphaproteobacteria bacterium]